MNIKFHSRYFSLNAIIVMVAMMVVYTIYSWCTPYALDDFMFAGYYLDGNPDESFTLSGLWNYISTVRSSENGRLANLLCAPIVMWLPHWLWALIFGAIVTTSITLSARLATGNKPVTAGMLIFVWALSVIFLPWQDFSGLVVIDYALNYLLSWVLVLLTLIFLLKVEEKTMRSSYYCPALFLAFLTGMIHESFSAVLLAAVTVYAAIKRFRMTSQWWGIYVALILGLIICLSAEGIINRVIRTTGLERPRDMMYFARLIYHTMSLCAIVGFVGIVMSFTKSGRSRLRDIFLRPVNVYVALIAIFATINIIAFYAPPRSAMMAVPPTIILLAGALQAQWNFTRYFSRIPSAVVMSLILTFYGGLIYWEYKIKLQNDVLFGLMKKANGRPVYFDTINDTPWYTFDYPVNGLWHYYDAHQGYIADYFGWDNSKRYVLPKVLENADLNKCDRIIFENNEGYFQIGNYLLSDSRNDRYLLPDRFRFISEDGSFIDSGVNWKPFDAGDSSVWCLGIPLKKEVKGPFVKIERL